jgi:uncharacterized protein YodC (DUF2158 family)
MPEQFQVGDLVQHISGFPEMAVVSVVVTDEGLRITCEWTEQYGVRTGTFKPEELKKIRSAKKPSYRS